MTNCQENRLRPFRPRPINLLQLGTMFEDARTIVRDVVVILCSSPETGSPRRMPARSEALASPRFGFGLSATHRVAREEAPRLAHHARAAGLAQRDVGLPRW